MLLDTAINMTKYAQAVSTVSVRIFVVKCKSVLVIPVSTPAQNTKMFLVKMSPLRRKLDAPSFAQADL